jgi:hypothetical protein
MRQVPHERELAVRLKGRPFALLGVNLDRDKVAARATAAKMGWSSWYDDAGEKGRGPIATRYHIISVPAVYVLDRSGVIRAKDVQGDELDRMVDALLVESETGKTIPSAARTEKRGPDQRGHS